MKEARQLPVRRDRVRAATKETITATARRLLVEQGPDAVSLRGIAREMGMTAPGLYRYFGSREEVLRHVIAQTLRGLADDIRRAIDEADAPFRDAPEPGQRVRLTVKLTAACQEFRRWAGCHKDEFALLFSAPLPGDDDAGSEIVQHSILEFAGTFYTMFIELWDTLPLPVPSRAEAHPGSGAQFEWFRDQLPRSAPDNAIAVFMRCWALLYGAVSAEIFGHTTVAFSDPDQMFEFVLGDLARLVGLEYPIP